MKKSVRIADMAEKLTEEIERTHGVEISKSIVYATIQEYMKKNHLKFAREIGD